jgi:hypothetical protein
VHGQTQAENSKGSVLVMDNNLLIFMHIPKTGGSTLNNIFKQQYQIGELLNHTSADILLQEAKAEKGNRIKAISGHHDFGIHKHFNCPSTYFSMVREPVDRVVSLYYFLASTPQYLNYESVKNMTLEEFVVKNAQAKNHQTSFFSGENQLNLEVAKKNLEAYFPVVGVTESFDESVFLLKKLYGWKNIVYKKENVTKKRPKIKDVPLSTIKLIEEYNRLDIELYNYAKKRLQQQLNTLTHAEKNELQAYKKQVNVKNK